jgi:hypothetical protein
MPLKKRRITMTAAAAAIAFTTAIPNAWAVTSPISGSTSWLSPCTDHWSVSSNVRYTSVANKQVRAKLSTTGPLGVQMRTRRESDGANSTIRNYPPLDSYQNLGKYSAVNTGFRLVFTCVNPRTSGSPSTDFAGTLDY